MKRSRRGGRRPSSHGGSHNSGGSSNNNNNGGYLNPNRTYDSNGPEIKVRGSASHVYEKYLQLARDANTQGDRVMAESYLQHAEHYFRIMAAIQAQQAQQAANNPQAQQQQPQNGQQNGNGQYRQPNGNGEQPYAAGSPQPAGPSFSLADGAQDVGEEVDAE
ncbi:MAG TPA: DUF4167 domain-containing protein [Rhizomicrobium sp.]|nr:DUF4167 domain-containing protein [Rhizomicrobium sp.]